MSFVAVSKVSFPAALKKEIQAIGLEMLPVARSQVGFISIAIHQSNEKNETMMYWEWESRSHHEACMKSEDWRAILVRHDSIFSQDGVQFSLETYERLG